MKKLLFILFVFCSINSIGQNFFWSYSGLTVYPIVTSSSMSLVQRYSATGGGNVVSEGKSAVTARGVCWSEFTNPTISSYHTVDGSGSGLFTSSLTSLTQSTTYYLRAYATNTYGTSYGENIIFTTDPDPCTASIGTNYGGGKIIYFLQSGDLGYDANVCHGLIMSSSLGYYNWGCNTTYLGASAQAIGYGQSNTTTIVNGCADSNCAARICDNLILNGYGDWYLPSLNEAMKMWNVLYLTESGINYWTSSEYDATSAYYVVNNTGNIINKNSNIYIRAIRSF